MIKGDKDATRMRLLRSASIVATVTATFAVVVPGAAYAQEAATPSSAPDAVEAAADSAQASEIVVTGTRIVRDGYTAPTPVSVVSAAELASATRS